MEAGDGKGDATSEEDSDETEVVMERVTWEMMWSSGTSCDGNG